MALGLAAQFIGQVTPAQAILSGTSAFRLDKIDKYLSNAGPDQYFKTGLRVAYSTEDARQLADSVLEEILGVYHPSGRSLQKPGTICGSGTLVNC